MPSTPFCVAVRDDGACTIEFTNVESLAPVPESLVRVLTMVVVVGITTLDDVPPGDNVVVG